MAANLSNQPIPYVSITKDIRVLDILGFRGGDLVSDVIAKLELKENKQCLITHVGIAVNDKLLPNRGLVPGKIYVMEATFSHKIFGIGDGVPDAITGEHKLGVQIRDLEEVVKKYITKPKTKVGWCKLKDNPWDKGGILTKTINRKKIVKKFARIFAEYEGRPFNLNMAELLATMFPKLRPTADHIDYFLKKITGSTADHGMCAWVFCSQLVSLIYQELGILPPGFDPKRVTPEDFLGNDIDGMPAIVDKPIFFVV